MHDKKTSHVPLHPIHTKEMHALGFDLIDLEGKGGKVYDSSVAHRHTFFELFLFTGGKGIHEVDFYSYPADKDTVHFVSPGQIHKLTLKNTKGHVFCFTEDFISLKAKESFIEKFSFYNSANPPVLSLSAELSAELSTLVKLFNNDHDRGNPDYPEILRSYLMIMLLKINSFYLSDEKIKNRLAGNKSKVVSSFKSLLNDNYLLHQPVSEYAKQLNISPNHLNALCKKHDGRTAIQLLQERLLLEAKRLLYATDMAIKEVSFYLRFEDVAYFNRFFKKQTGLTPVEYREEFQKK